MKLALLGLLLVTTLAYSRLWRAGFVYEDANAVSQNPAVVGTAPIAIDRARWISALSHRLVWNVSHGPRLHHAVNLGLHLGNGALVYAIAGAFVAPPAAWLAAAIFLLHPLQTEAVAYVASRSELLATCFALLAFWRSLTADRWTRHVVVWGCVALAVCAKESAAAIVPLIAIADVFRGRSISRWWYAALLAPVLAMAYSVFQFDYLARAELNQLDYAATQATAVWRYLGIVILPIGQSVDHDFDLVTWGWRYLALLGMWSLALIPIFGAMTAVHGDTRQIARLRDESDRYRVAAFGMTWLLITIGPRFVMRTTEILNEHQFYSSMFGISLAISVILQGWLGESTRIVRSVSSRGRSVVASLCVLGFCGTLHCCTLGNSPQTQSMTSWMARTQRLSARADNGRTDDLSTDFHRPRERASSDAIPCDSARLGKSQAGRNQPPSHPRDAQRLPLAMDVRVHLRHEGDASGRAGRRSLATAIDNAGPSLGELST